jgi:hypothetical protein
MNRAIPLRIDDSSDGTSERQAENSPEPVRRRSPLDETIADLRRTAAELSAAAERLHRMRELLEQTTAARRPPTDAPPDPLKRDG